jgi:hypothetical protein
MGAGIGALVGWTLAAALRKFYNAQRRPLGPRISTFK